MVHSMHTISQYIISLTCYIYSPYALCMSYDQVGIPALTLTDLNIESNNGDNQLKSE